MCEEAFTTWVFKQGVERILDSLGEMLWQLYGIASCRWGCRGGDHQEEQLLSRTAGTASATLLLLKRGYFDPASGLLRELAETINLLYLFTLSRQDYQQWLQLDDTKRKNQYSAFNVRLKIEKLHAIPPTEQEIYQFLSQYGVHPGPGSEPRGHDSVDKPTVGTPYRPAVSFALARALNTVVTTALLFGKDLLTQPDIRQEILETAQTAMKEVARIDFGLLKEEESLVLPTN